MIRRITTWFTRTDPIFLTLLGLLIFFLLILVFILFRKTRTRLGIVSLQKEQESIQPLEQPIEPEARPQDTLEFIESLPFVTKDEFRRDAEFLYGMRIYAVFLPNRQYNQKEQTVRRLLPFLPQDFAKILYREVDRRNFRFRSLCAQPDAVLRTSKGLIVLEYKTRGGRHCSPNDWRRQLRPADLIQTVLGAIAVAHETNQPVAPILRTTNAIYYIMPTPDVVEFLLSRLDPAARLMGHADIASSDAAQLLAVLLRKRYPLQDRNSSAGEVAHQQMLR